MSSSPIVSIVIPVYEKWDVLDVVLRHFEYQDYPTGRFEVIVVDDGSPEGIGSMLRTRSFPFRFALVEQENRGRAAARNAGIRRAAGEVVVFCDADRIPGPSFVSLHAAFHDRWARSAAVGIPWDCFLAFETIRQDGPERISTINRFSRVPAYYATFCRLLPSEEHTSPIAWAGFLVGNSSLRRSDLMRVGGFDEDLRAWGIEHFELALRLMQDQTTVRYLHQGGNYHVPHARNVDYFRDGIDKGITILSKKANERPLALLREFLFGELSLQEFEMAYCGRTSAHLKSSEPIFFRQLTRDPNRARPADSRPTQ